MVFGLLWYPVLIFWVVRFNGATVNDLCVITTKYAEALRGLVLSGDF